MVIPFHIRRAEAKIPTVKGAPISQLRASPWLIGNCFQYSHVRRGQRMIPSIHTRFASIGLNIVSGSRIRSETEGC